VGEPVSNGLGKPVIFIAYNNLHVLPAPLQVVHDTYSTIGGVVINHQDLTIKRMLMKD
jgi:hypothetical protein